MKAILTKVLPCTETKRRRVKAYDLDGNSVTVTTSWLSGQALHEFAAKELCAKMNWPGQMACGETREGFAFVFLD